MSAFSEVYTIISSFRVQLIIEQIAIVMLYKQNGMLEIKN